MNFPKYFQFSQGNLQDYYDCQRRFQLRYILQLDWPAVEVEPEMENERYLRLGAQFHHMIRQNILGVSSERLQEMIRDVELSQWWQNYLNYARTLVGLGDIPHKTEPNMGLVTYPEISLHVPIGEYYIIAKYDLITISTNEKIIIFDWKTSRKLPKRLQLAERLQTRVYPYLLARSGAQLNTDKLIQPEQIEMVYWFAGFPEQPVRFPYSLNQFQADDIYIRNIIEQIAQKCDVGDIFPMTNDERRCLYCVYRSLCDRGIKAGHLDELEGDTESGQFIDFDIDFEQIAEIEF